MNHRTDIMTAIFIERYRQDALHPWDDSTQHLAIVAEELGEVAAAMQGDGILRDELVQLAAVCVRWLELIYDKPIL